MAGNAAIENIGMEGSTNDVIRRCHPSMGSLQAIENVYGIFYEIPVLNALK
jgi:hypothetical protein